MKCCYFVSSDFIKKDEIFSIEITIVLIAPHHIEFEVSNIETNKLVEVLQLPLEVRTCERTYQELAYLSLLSVFSGLLY